jgi:hypothetical protein
MPSPTRICGVVLDRVIDGHHDNCLACEVDLARVAVLCEQLHRTMREGRDTLAVTSELLEIVFSRVGPEPCDMPRPIPLISICVPASSLQLLN